jgi:5-methylcytosine-specific restriction protein A
MSEGSVVALRAVMDSMAALRALEFSGDAESRIDGLKTRRMVRRQCDFDSLELIAGLDQDGEFADRGVRAANAVCDLLGVSRRDAGRMVAVASSVFPTRTLLGEVLEPKLPATAMALGALEIDLAHAEVIESVLATDAAGRISVQQWAAAEVLFADWAREVNPRQLARHAHDHLEMLDQDGAPPGEDDPQVNELHLSKSRYGVGGRIKGQLDAVTFEVVARAIAAILKPAADEDKSLGQRQADALGEICAHALDEGRLPAQGGERPHVSVIMGLDALKAGLRGVHLDFGGRIGPGEVRRLCCDAQVTPIVLGARSEPLDVGREQRCATLPQRRAIAVRDGGCAHPECDRPASWCEIHHIIHWVDGGETNLDNLVMLCWTHHRMMHRSGWIVRIRDGLAEFIPPKWIDYTQTPRRKPRTLALADCHT